MPPLPRPHKTPSAKSKLILMLLFAPWPCCMHAAERSPGRAARCCDWERRAVARLAARWQQLPKFTFTHFTDKFFRTNLRDDASSSALLCAASRDAHASNNFALPRHVGHRSR